MQGRRDGTGRGRGATIETLAADDRDPWAPLARRVMDDLSTLPEVVTTLDAAGLSGRERVVFILYTPWARGMYSFRALAAATGTTPRAIVKTYQRARGRLKGAEYHPPPETPTEAYHGNFDAIASIMAEPPVPLPRPKVRANKDGAVRGNLYIDRHGTHWPPERWQPPAASGVGYGRVTFPPQGPIDDLADL